MRCIQRLLFHKKVKCNHWPIFASTTIFFKLNLNETGKKTKNKLLITVNAAKYKRNVKKVAISFRKMRKKKVF